MTLSEKIKEYRKANKLTQAEFANKAGISRTYLSMIERGESTNLSLDVYNRITNTLANGPRRYYKSEDEILRELEELGKAELIAVIRELRRENSKARQQVTTSRQDVTTLRTLWQLEKEKTKELEKQLKLWKPSWDDAPEWAQALAQNDDFSWGWYERKPRLDMIADFEGWFSDDEMGLFEFASAPNWQDTLEERPCSQ